MGDREMLQARMRELVSEDICLAFSGGVDSSLLLKVAADAAAETGKKVYAVTFDSRLHPSCDLRIARQVAGELGGIHQVMEVDELEQEKHHKERFTIGYKPLLSVQTPSFHDP